jgi:hypothetical protein
MFCVQIVNRLRQHFPLRNVNVEFIYEIQSIKVARWLRSYWLLAISVVQLFCCWSVFLQFTTLYISRASSFLLHVYKLHEIILLKFSILCDEERVLRNWLSACHKNCECVPQHCTEGREKKECHNNDCFMFCKEEERKTDPAIVGVSVDLCS